MEDEIVATDVDRFRGQLLDRLFCPFAGVADEVLVEHVFPAAARRLHNAAARLEIRIVGRNGGDGEGNGDAHNGLRDH